MTKDLTIKNSTAEFLIFQSQAKDSIEVKYADETVWLSQKMIAKHFDKGRNTITEHLKEIFKSGELDEKEVSSILEHTTKHGAINGKTQTKTIKFYNLDAIIAVGYTVLYSINITAQKIRIFIYNNTNELIDMIKRGGANYKVFLKIRYSLHFI